MSVNPSADVGGRTGAEDAAEFAMKITFTDWLVVGAYFLVNLLIGLYFRKKASASTSDFFVSGRQVTWWLAGSSMVATTFAADTPIWVTGQVAK